ncbi:MAG: exodeoxyribonuclease VII large subunit, partial [Pseudomonadota bacterium]
ARLSPSTLNRAHLDAKRRLEQVRLVPALIERPIKDGRERLASLTRIASQLHPEKPLERGYAIVRDISGMALTDKAQAEKETALELQFKDGRLQVGTGDAALPAAKPKRKSPRPKPTAAQQEDLFG